MDSVPFRHRRTVEFAETDMAGILHFSNYFRYMEATESAFFRELEEPLFADQVERAAGFPRVRVECSYSAPLRFGDAVEVALYVQEVGDRSVRYRFDFLALRAAGKAERVAKGSMTTVWAEVDRRQGLMRSAALPAGLRTKLLARLAPAEAAEVPPPARAATAARTAPAAEVVSATPAPAPKPTPAAAPLAPRMKTSSPGKGGRRPARNPSVVEDSPHLDLVDEAAVPMGGNDYLPVIEVREPKPVAKGRERDSRRGSQASGAVPAPKSGVADPRSAMPPARPRAGGGPLVISKDSINDLPLFTYEGPVHIINRDDQIYDAVVELRKEKVLGFDTETRPTFRAGVNHPVALLQLAGAHAVYLFQLLQLKDVSPVFGLLASPRLAKVGVAIRDDIKKLQDKLAFEPHNFIEISDLSTRAGILNTGLRALAAHYMQIRVSKGAQVSNWALKELTEPQVRYAATDAWISRELYLKLVDLGHG